MCWSERDGFEHVAVFAGLWLRLVVLAAARVNLIIQRSRVGQRDVPTEKAVSRSCSRFTTVPGSTFGNSQTLVVPLGVDMAQ